MKEQSASGILGTTIEKIRDLVDVSTIIGDPMYLEGGMTIIPVLKGNLWFCFGRLRFPLQNKRAAFWRRRAALA